MEKKKHNNFKLELPKEKENKALRLKIIKKLKIMCRKIFKERGNKQRD